MDYNKDSHVGDFALLRNVLDVESDGVWIATGTRHVGDLAFFPKCADEPCPKQNHRSQASRRMEYNNDEARW